MNNKLFSKEIIPEDSVIQTALGELLCIFMKHHFKGGKIKTVPADAQPNHPDLELAFSGIDRCTSMKLKLFRYFENIS